MPSRSLIPPRALPVVMALLASWLPTAPAVAGGPGGSGGSAGDKYENTLAKDFIMDAPWRVVDPDTPIPVTIILKDCDVDDIRQLHWGRIEDVTSGVPVILWQHDFGDEQLGDDPTEHNFWTWITTVTEGHPTLPDGTALTPAVLGYGAGDVVALNVKVYYKDDILNYTEHRVLRVQVGTGPFPWPADWYGGDTHFHTMYTNNIYEYGAPLPAVRLAARAMGLHWLTTTDHSCDLDETGDGAYSYATRYWEYTIQDTQGIVTVLRDNVALGSSWAALGAETALLDGPDFRLQRAAEVNLASIDPLSTGKTLHCLMVNPVEVVSPASGAPGERPVSPTLPVGLDALDPLGFAYAAHPTDDLSAEVLGFDWGINGAVWGRQDLLEALLRPRFMGLEIFNTRSTVRSADQYDPWADFDAGLPVDNPYPDPLLTAVALWTQLIHEDLAGPAAGPGAAPRRLFLAGGSDAHGDFNYSTHMAVDDYAEDNALGKVQTVVFVPNLAAAGYGPSDLPPMDLIMAAYRDGRSCATDGPFLEIGLDVEGDGIWTGPQDLMMGQAGTLGATDGALVHLRWASLPEFGEVAAVHLWGLDGSGVDCQLAEILPQTTGAGLAGVQSLPLAGLPWAPQVPAGWHALRAELVTDDGLAGHRALTNPIWLRIDPESGADPAALPPRPRLLGNHPNPFNPLTAIEFELPAAGPASLQVLALDGRLVRTLLEGQILTAGRHGRPWDGRDDRGRAVPSGLYFARLRAGGSTLSTKMLLVR